jgi:Rad3-related DNA helicase
VSQAAGRLIRHQMDFGVLFSIDSRYKTPSATLAPWIVQNRVIAGPDLFERVSAFFEERTSAAQGASSQPLVVHKPIQRTGIAQYLK